VDPATTIRASLSNPVMIVAPCMILLTTRSIEAGTAGVAVVAFDSADPDFFLDPYGKNISPADQSDFERVSPGGGAPPRSTNGRRAIRIRADLRAGGDDQRSAGAGLRRGGQATFALAPPTSRSQSGASSCCGHFEKSESPAVPGGGGGPDPGLPAAAFVGRGAGRFEMFMLRWRGLRRRKLAGTGKRITFKPPACSRRGSSSGSSNGLSRDGGLSRFDPARAGADIKRFVKKRERRFLPTNARLPRGIGETSGGTFRPPCHASISPRQGARGQGFRGAAQRPRVGLKNLGAYVGKGCPQSRAPLHPRGVVGESNLVWFGATENTLPALLRFFRRTKRTLFSTRSLVHCNRI